MRNLIFCLLLFGFTGLGHSQIVLGEAKVDYDPASLKVDPATNSVTIKIPEKKIGEFQNDPLLFIDKNFDIHQFLLDNRDLDFELVQVLFQGRKGHVRANYSRKGDLISTYHKFKNVNLPNEAMMEIYRTYPDYRVVKNVHIAKTKNGELKKEFYRVKVKNGSSSKTLKFDKTREGISLAGM